MYKKKHRENNRKRTREMDAEYREQYREERRISDREYREINKDVRNAKRRQYGKDNPDVIHASNLRRRSLMEAGRTERSITPEELVVLKQSSDFCYYCGIQMKEDVNSTDPAKKTIDHMTPVTRGGTDAPENYVCACRLCNSRKYTKTAEEYFEILSAQEDALFFR